MPTAQKAYTGTIDTDRRPRDLVVEALCGCRGILDQKAAQDLVKEVHALAYDMIAPSPLISASVSISVSSQGRAEPLLPTL